MDGTATPGRRLDMPSGERFIDIHAVAAKVGLSTKTVRRRIKAKAFPPPFTFCGALRWLESDVDRWMVRHAAAHEIDPAELDEGWTGRDREGHSGTSAPEGDFQASEQKRKK